MYVTQKGESNFNSCWKLQSMGQGQGKDELRAAEEQEMLSLKGSGVEDGWIQSRGQSRVHC